MDLLCGMFLLVVLYLLTDVSAYICSIDKRYSGLYARHPDNDNDYYLTSEIECLSNGVKLSWNISKRGVFDIALNVECRNSNGDNVFSITDGRRQTGVNDVNEKKELVELIPNGTLASLKMNDGKCTLFGCSVKHDHPENSTLFLYFRNDSCSYKTGPVIRENSIQVIEPSSSTIDKSLLVTSTTHTNIVHVTTTTDLTSLKSFAETVRVTTTSLIVSPMETSVLIPTSSQPTNSTVIIPTEMHTIATESSQPTNSTVIIPTEMHTIATAGDITNTVSSGTISSYMLYATVTILVIPVVAILLLFLLLCGKKNYMRSKYLSKSWKSRSFEELDLNYTPVKIGKDNSKYESTESILQYLGLSKNIDNSIDNKSPGGKQHHLNYETSFSDTYFSPSKHEKNIFKPSLMSSGYQFSSSPRTAFNLEHVFSDSDSVQSVHLESTQDEVHAPGLNPLFYVKQSHCHNFSNTMASSSVSTVNYQQNDDANGCGDTDSIILSDEDTSSNVNRVILTFSSQSYCSDNESDISSAAEYNCKEDKLQFDTHLTESNLILNPDHFDPLPPSSTHI